MKLKEFLDVIDWDTVPSSVIFLIPIVGKEVDYDSKIGYNEGEKVNWNKDLIIMDDNDSSPWEPCLYSTYSIDVQRDPNNPNSAHVIDGGMEPYVIDEHGQIYVVIY